MKNRITACVVGLAVLFCTPHAVSADEYTYDALQRLTKAVYDDGASIAYTYDAEGNRLKVVVVGGKPNQLPVDVIAGVAFEMPLPGAFSGASGVTVKGLPAGLKYDIAQKKITGVASKAGSFDVVLSAEGMTPQPVKITVAALPVWAQGVFNGDMQPHAVGDGSFRGLATMAVTAAGKVTGKLTFGGKTYAFAAPSYASASGEVFTVRTKMKVGAAELDLVLPLKRADIPASVGAAAQTLSVVEDGSLGGQYSLYLSRNVLKEVGAQAISPYIGYYTATLPGNEKHGSGYLTFTVDKVGLVKIAGKLADGTAVSQSGVLIVSNFGGSSIGTFLYTAPTAYKGGCFYGWVLFMPEGEDRVCIRNSGYYESAGESYAWHSPIAWSTLNPQATGVYGDGFNYPLEITGGKYDKLGNLHDYYAGKALTAGTDTNAPSPELVVGTSRYDSLWWSPAGVALTPTLKSGVMTGLAAPAAGKPADADKNGVWDYSAENSVGLKIALTRATGIFKGSFLAWFDYPDKKHVSKSLAFEGALTPVREDLDDGVAGRGFFLWADKGAIPETGKTYPFAWSYDFKILMTDMP